MSKARVDCLLITAKALDLSESGEIVCQLHSTGEITVTAWQCHDRGATLHPNSDGNYVVTTDGVKHSV